MGLSPPNPRIEAEPVNHTGLHNGKNAVINASVKVSVFTTVSLPLGFIFMVISLTPGVEIGLFYVLSPFILYLRQTLCCFHVRAYQMLDFLRSSPTGSLHC